METNYNFQDLWKQKETNTPDSRFIIKKANAYRKNQLLISSCLITSLLATCGVIIWVWVSFPDLHVLTKSGIMLIVTALLFFIFLNLQKVKIINGINPSLSNQDYLKQMKILQKKQMYIQTKGFTIYFLLNFFGLAFYLFEFTQRMSALWGAFTYSLIFAWILFVWFYIKPKRTRKQQQKIRQVIDSLESLEKGFSE
ncbi:hypothetical protein [Epilithonimonas mollis]|uniref:Uncharacterized protein n=1 Tax=Epilithonimonas mollis TaxID=216903 RepID=A0A1M6Q3Q0_9FLAO|nr:hypothetical protein [Epilithonimonas mollis]SHK14761.1 hypothetical protein SAMN05444371_1490 [Epilithonimonas mollis]